MSDFMMSNNKYHCDNTQQLKTRFSTLSVFSHTAHPQYRRYHVSSFLGIRIIKLHLNISTIEEAATEKETNTRICRYEQIRYVLSKQATHSLNSIFTSGR